jgi:hypothetical protein
MGGAKFLKGGGGDIPRRFSCDTGMTAIMLAIFLCYLKFSKHVNEYEKLPVNSDDDVDNSNANDDNKHIK